ncbi:MAG: radical SAM protein [Bacteroidales bacterium]
MRFSALSNLPVISASYAASVASGRPLVWGMPPAVGIELTNYCNLSCPECHTGSGAGTRTRGFIDPALFRKIIDELKPWLLNINLYFQGEPMMHPRFFDLLELSSGINTTLSTNGHFLSEENVRALAASKLGTIIVSLDGMTEETYSKYRVGGHFFKVVDGIRKLADEVRRSGSPLRVKIQFLVNRYNEHQIADLKNFAREHGAGVILKSMQVISADAHADWMPEMPAFKRYENSTGIYMLRSRLSDRCARLWFNPVITWDGKVLPCCFDKDGDHVMGDLTKTDFRTTWHGKTFNAFRSSLLEARKEIRMCTNCTSGLKT